VGNKCAAAGAQNRQQQHQPDQLTNAETMDEIIEMPAQGAFSGSGLDRILQSKAKAGVMQQDATMIFGMVTPFQCVFEFRGAKDVRQVEQLNRFAPG
jgi:hypothetical protein